MAMIAKPPHIRLAEAALDTLNAVNWVDRVGFDLKWRHKRNRWATKSEMPDGALRWLGNRDQNEEGRSSDRNAQERARLCDFDLEIYLAVKTEESGDDPTGWLVHSLVSAAAIEALRDEGTSLIYPALCDWIIDGDEDPDEDSKPDEGRLVKSISVVYRVRSDAPNVLLGQGVDG